MAAYPSVMQVYGSKILGKAGTIVDRAVSGKPRFRTYYTQVWDTITVKHDLDDTDKALIEAHYATDKLLSFSFTYDADSSSHTAKYASVPSYVPKKGNRWDVTTTLIVV